MRQPSPSLVSALSSAAGARNLYGSTTTGAPARAAASSVPRAPAAVSTVPPRESMAAAPEILVHGTSWVADDAATLLPINGFVPP
jgi:hypothetical protein